ncbi:LPS export ABC transporter permease LptG [bacterium]|nr:LPS export ABC transporter permease LptG [bacterium]
MKQLDRYILRTFFRFFLFAMIASAVIFITIDLIEHLDKFIDAKLHYSIVLQYYYLYIPYIFYLTMPVAVLLATLFSIGGFVYRHEMTAMQSAGYSLWRIMGLFLLVAFPLSAGILVFGETIVPEANHVRKEIYRVQVKGGQSPTSTQMGRLFIQTGPSEFMRMDTYDPVQEKGSKIDLQTIHDDGVAKSVTADEISWSKDHWVLKNAVTLSFDELQPVRTHQDSIIRADLNFTPEDLKRVNIAPEEMSYPDLKNLVARLQAGGNRAGKWIVDLAFKISQPFATVIIVLFGVPFAAYRRRGGIVLGFGLSLLVCFVYFGFMQTGKILGYSGAIDPIVAAWTGNIVFAVFGFVLLIRVPK